MHSLKWIERLGVIPRRLFSTANASHPSRALTFNGLSLPYRWLRDSCQCPSCVHPSTRQKLHRTSDIPADSQPKSDGIKYADDGVHITWSSGHQSYYTKTFLDLYSSPQKLHAFHQDQELDPWDVGRLRSAPDLFVPYEAIQTPPGLSTAITQLTRYGLLFLTGVPINETSNAKCELRILAERFGEIRTTFYGETWDVKKVKDSRNIAYTNIDLGLHMDILYFQHPPRYQILHCLRNRVEGGSSIFVDALNAAAKLRQSHPSDFDILASTPVTFHYINDGHHLHHSHPTIELAPYSRLPSGPGGAESSLRPIQFVNYSPPFQAPLPLSTPAAFYPALERFVSLLEDPAVRLEYTLREGDAVLFDNRRVLHARTAFTDRADDDVGKGKPGGDGTNRWLKGCYLEADAVLDRGRVLRQQVQQE
ncbi:hypothetical protein AcV5_009519 [Taiwanofungus camphoratus]|nr:hypothetical protein AcV5_009519 [Antrodia cinnamomea]